MRLLLSSRAQADLDRLSSDDLSNVVDELEQWADSRDSGIIYENRRKVRSVDEDIHVAKVGPSRIFFSEDHGDILVLSVVNRDDFEYEDLYRSGWKSDE